MQRKIKCQLFHDAILKKKKVYNSVNNKVFVRSYVFVYLIEEELHTKKKWEEKEIKELLMFRVLVWVYVCLWLPENLQLLNEREIETNEELSLI